MTSESYAIQDLIIMEGADSSVSAISHLIYEFPGAKIKLNLD